VWSDRVNGALGSLSDVDPKFQVQPDPPYDCSVFSVGFTVFQCLVLGLSLEAYCLGFAVEACCLGLGHAS